MRHKSIISIFSIFILSIGIAAAAQLTNIEEQFSASSVKGLSVSLSGGDVQIEASASGTAVVNAVGIDQADADKVKIYLNESDGVLNVEFKPDGNSRSKARFEIAVPNNVPIDAHTAGGNVRVGDHFTSDVDVNTAGGDISLGNVDGKVAASTAGGDISVGIIGQGSVTTAGGDISVDTVSGQVKITTAGGDISVGNIGGELKATSGGGDVSLGDITGFATVQTAGGDISVGAVTESATLETAGGDISLSSATGEVTAKTAGGDLSLREVSGSIEAKTAGGDIDAELTPSGQDSSLTTASGDIDLSIPSGGANIKARIRVGGNWEKNIKKLDIYRGETEVGKHDPAKREITADLTVADGGPTITLETMNGNIRVKQPE